MDMKSSYNLSELINSSLLSEYNDILNDTEEFDKLFSMDSDNTFSQWNTSESDKTKEQIILEKIDIINKNIYVDNDIIDLQNITEETNKDSVQQIPKILIPEVDLHAIKYSNEMPVSVACEGLQEIIINGLEARTALKKKLDDKKISNKNKKQPLITKEDNQINMLKNNPLFKNIENADKESIKKIIDTVAGGMTNDSKQKKNIKKQVEKLIDKMIEKKI